jgi:pimeloyl-ACP methyl ester carboxylesterase
METAEVNGVVLQYEVTGAGDPVLLIGTGPIADSFLPLLSEQALADHFRMVRYRQRRRGADAERPEPVSFAQHAADAAALLRRLGIRRAHVAGHSTGGSIALELAADHPDLVQSLALLEPTLVNVPSAPAFFAKVGPAQDAFAAGDRAGAMTAFLTLACGLDWDSCRARIDEHVPGGVAQSIDDAENFFGSYLPALDAWKFGRERAAALSVPVLSVVGTETARMFAESHALLHDWLPQVEDCAVDGVAHLLHMQRPEPVARGMAEFFTRHRMR